MDPARTAKLRDIRVIIKTVDGEEAKKGNQVSKGNIELVLYTSKAPELVANFVNLSRRGFFVGLYFHKKKNFMIQSGCPESNGSGNAGYHLKDTFHDSLKHDGPGVVAMANIGPDTNSSQFCIMTQAASWLDGKSSIIGRVTKGMDVVDKLVVGDQIESVKVLDSVRELNRIYSTRIKRWNKLLDAKREAE